MTKSPEIVQRLSEYPRGTRVRHSRSCPCSSDATHNDSTRVPPGTEGTVIDIDDAGIHVAWDNLSLITNLDELEKI